MRIRQKELRQRHHRREQRLKAASKGVAITGTGAPAPRPVRETRPARPAGGATGAPREGRPERGGGAGGGAPRGERRPGGGGGQRGERPSNPPAPAAGE